MWSKWKFYMFKPSIKKELVKTNELNKHLIQEDRKVTKFQPQESWRNKLRKKKGGDKRR